MLGIRGQLVRVALEFGQVIERIGSAKFAGVNQAHVEIAHAGAILRLVKQGVLPVKDRLLDRTFIMPSSLPLFSRKRAC